ncbi:hypothetical protein C8J57DRAFT_1227255 [Mycena rebaudengoi]|nr:hypothetical protein C8J57DRAFT_1227255 [Mycena rebaudengoi]
MNTSFFLPAWASAFLELASCLASQLAPMDDMDDVTFTLSAADTTAILTALPGLVQNRAPISPTRNMQQHLQDRMGRCLHSTYSTCPPVSTLPALPPHSDSPHVTVAQENVTLSGSVPHKSPTASTPVVPLQPPLHSPAMPLCASASDTTPLLADVLMPLPLPSPPQLPPPCLSLPLNAVGYQVEGTWTGMTGDRTYPVDRKFGDDREV